MYLPEANQPIARPIQTKTYTLEKHTQYQRELAKIIQKFTRAPLSHYTSIQNLGKCVDGESWASTVVKCLLDTLSFDGSENGKYWTPDADIVNYLGKNIPQQKVWIKILWTKLEILEALLPNMSISETHKRRIKDISIILKTIYQKPTP